MEYKFKIECEECDAVTEVHLEDQDRVEFCPVCGRRVEAEDISEHDI